MTDGATYFFQTRPSDWMVAHGGSLRLMPDGVEFSDTAEPGWHLMRVIDAGFVDRVVEVRLTATPCAGCDTDLYLNRWGGVSLASVSVDGRVRPGGAAGAVQARVDAQGRLTVEASWPSSSHAIFVGTSATDGRGDYVGRGAPQWTIHSLEATCRPPPFTAPARLVLVDVGAAGGVDAVWSPLPPRMHCVFVEPDPQAAEDLRRQLHLYPSAQVVEAALSDRDEVRPLNITRFGLCCSLLEPDFDVLGRYAVAPCFEVVRTSPVHCRRYDATEHYPPPT